MKDSAKDVSNLISKNENKNLELVSKKIKILKRKIH